MVKHFKGKRTQLVDLEPRELRIIIGLQKGDRKEGWSCNLDPAISNLRKFSRARAIVINKS